MRKKEDMKMGYAHGKDKVHSMGYMGGSQMVMPMGYAHGKDKVHPMGYMGGNQMVMPMGYAYGTKMTSPMGYYSGSLYAEATPQQEQEMMAMAPGVRIQATGPTDDFGQPSEATQMAAATTQQAVTEGVEDEIADPIAKKIAGSVIEDGKQALTEKAIEAGTEKATQEVAKASTQELAKAGVEAAGGKLASAKAGALAGAASGLSSGIAGGVGSLASDVVSGKGITKEGASKALMQAGLTAVLGPVGGFISGLFAKDGTPEVPPMGYAGGVPDADNQYAKEAAKRAKMSPEEIQEQFLKQRVLPPLMQRFEEASVPAKVAMAAIPAGLAYETGRLPLGQFRGGKLEGGKDRLSYKHPKFGDFEVNPESERVSYRKTFRF